MKQSTCVPVCGGNREHGTCSGCAIHDRGQDQSVAFGCIDYYTTQCVFDITNTELANGIGSYMTAMRAFA